MSSFEPKKLAIIRILQILKKHSDVDNQLTQEEISNHLISDYGIEIERKAIGRNIAMLKDIGYDIVSSKKGCYLCGREFDDSELRMLIDGVLSSKYITASHTKDLINRLCDLSSKSFSSSVKHVQLVNDWCKTENSELFLNISFIEEAIKNQKQIKYDFYKYNEDKKFVKSSEHIVSPYQMMLHNQRYYLFSYSEALGKITYQRIDHMKSMTVLDTNAKNLRTIKGYENGIDYQYISSNLPYMYTDEQERVIFLASTSIIDQIVDWFGTHIDMQKVDENTVKVSFLTSPSAMKHWALQYLDYVEVLSPSSLVDSIKKSLEKARKKY